MTSVPSPSDTFYFAEAHELHTLDHFHFAEDPDGTPGGSGGFDPAPFANLVAVDRHLGGANYLFVDAHAETVKWTVVNRRLITVGDCFVRPDGRQ